MGLSADLTPRVPMLMAVRIAAACVSGRSRHAAAKKIRDGPQRPSAVSKTPRTSVAFALPVVIGHSDDVNQIFSHDNKYL